MKQANRTAQAKTTKPGRIGKRAGGRKGRHEINRFLRRFLIFILFVLMISVLFAGYASVYPFVFTLPTPIFDLSRSSNVNYEVQLNPNGFTEQTALGMDQIYLRDFTRAIKIDFQHWIHVGQASSIQYTYRVDALVRAHDAADPSLILLTRQISLLPETAGQISGSDLNLSQGVSVDLNEYEEFIASYQDQTSQAATFDVVVSMSVKAAAALPFGSYVVTDAPGLQIPLDQAQYQLTRILPASLPAISFQPVTYRLVLTDLPFAVYPAMAGACFLLLILLLAATRSRKKNRFNRRLHKMLRRARGRLMIIGDKAWEPQWCVTTTDFKSMVRTAKKLKHPIFCYIDRMSPVPAAYFYIYYGENNYCFTFSDANSSPAMSIPPASDDLSDFPDFDDAAPPADDDRIPLLPENDDSPEIALANLKIQSGYSPN